MAKFALYYIPPAESTLYQQGSEILGYDVRTGEMLPEDNLTRARLPEFDSAWITQPQTYGFHVTTGYSLYFEMSSLPQVEQAMEDVFNCANPSLEYVFTPNVERVVFWSDTVVALRYDPNPYLLMLHTLLVAHVHPHATGSNMTSAYAKQNTALDPLKANRVRLFHSPYILEAWTPHFTLMMPYTGSKRSAMHQTLLTMFSDAPIKVESLCLLVREDHETHYRLHREYYFKDYPKPLIAPLMESSR